MLVELAVRDLGVIASARVTLGHGATALTGETGAGKTMVVEALELLRGGRADPGRVRTGADEAVVEALFVTDGAERGDDGREVVVRRVVPATGRSRAYVDGDLVPVARLEEVVSGLLEIHGQHTQQGLLRPAAQRGALDRFGDIDTRPLQEAVAEVRTLERRLSDLGGDERVRARELDLLRYQVDEIDAAALRPGEDELLDVEEDLLAGAVDHRLAADAAGDLLAGSGAGDDAGGDRGGAVDLLAGAVARLRGRAPFVELVARFESLGIELDDAVADLRLLAGTIEVDDERLTEVRTRRQRLVELRRKYGERIEDVLGYAEETRARLDELERQERDAATIDADLARARERLVEAAGAVGAARRAAAPVLATAVSEQLRHLAMADCVVEVHVADSDELPGAGDRVTVLLAANPGVEPAPLQRVASGGELSRVMLALRLVSSGGPATMVFDEVDAGIGGAAATAVAEALAGVARDHQVIVVTHLPQIAAVAASHLGVEKTSADGSTATTVRPLDREERIVEVSRMLSGSPDSETARRHAEELLAAGVQR